MITIVKLESRSKHLLREDIKKKLVFGGNGTIGGEGVRKFIEFSSFTNDEKHGRGGSQSNISLLHRTQL